ncbi:CYTH domain-containing protein [Candidatus Microgenomates bacterium]|nr:CYTH domain-containing protein [Candidatus Microgenomates bacterium]
MHREIEAKILNINPKVIQAKLKKLGAKLERELDLDQVVWWVPGEGRKSLRVRKASNGSIQLNLKSNFADGLGYHEWETDVKNYEYTIAMMDQILPVPDLRVEYGHHRQDWYLDGVLINIDWFPRLKPLVEIEAESEEKVYEIAEKLGFKKEDCLDEGVVSLLFKEFKLKRGQKVKLS